MEDNTNIVVNKSFKKFLAPTMIGSISMVSALLVDASLISHFFGSNGLIIVSLGMPLELIWCLIYVGLGIGASTIFSIYLGANNAEKGRDFVARINTFALSVTLTFSVLGLLATPFLSAEHLKVDPLFFPDALRYIQYLLLATIPLVLNNYLLFLVRADSSPRIASASTVTQVILNLLLDLLFMGPMQMGVQGAALAMLIASSVALTISISSLCRKQSVIGFSFKMFNKASLRPIWGYATCSAIDNLTGFLFAFIFNLLVLHTFGTKITSIYYLTNYILTFIAYCSMGLSYSTLPLLSVFFGEENKKGITLAMQKGLKSAIIIGSFLAILIYTFSKFIAVDIFNFQYNELYELCSRAILLFATSIPFFLINFVIIRYLQQANKIKEAGIFALFRYLILPSIFVSISLVSNQLDLLWLRITFSEIIVLVGIVIYGFIKKKHLGADSIFCLPNFKPYKSSTHYLILPKELNKLADYQRMAELYLSEQKVDDDKRRRIVLAFEEVFIYAQETHQHTSSYIDIQLVITHNDEVKLLVKLDNKGVNMKEIARENIENSDFFLSLHLLRSLSKELSYSKVLSFNTLNMVF
ncbi:MAG: MATE family efflux transporter [Phocaeicola sp.]